MTNPRSAGLFKILLRRLLFAVVGLFLTAAVGISVLGWALSGTLGGIMIGAPATAILVVFVIGFLMPLKILVAVIQTFIFCKLAMVYIAAAVEDTEHH